MRKRIYMLQGGSSVRRHLEDRSLCSGFSARTSFSPGGEEKETLFIRFINFPSLTYSQNNDLRCTAALITLPEVFVFSFTRRCPSKGRCREAARAESTTLGAVFWTADDAPELVDLAVF